MRIKVTCITCVCHCVCWGGFTGVLYTWCKDYHLECAWFANTPSGVMTFSFVINTPPLSPSRSFSACTITGIHKNAKRFSKDRNSSAKTLCNIADHFPLNCNSGHEAKKNMHSLTLSVQRLLSPCISDCQIPHCQFTSKSHLSLIEPYCLPRPDFTARSIVYISIVCAIQLVPWVIDVFIL